MSTALSDEDDIEMDSVAEGGSQGVRGEDWYVPVESSQQGPQVPMHIQDMAAPMRGYPGWDRLSLTRY